MVYNGVNKLIAENLDMLAKEEVAPAFPAGTSDDPMHQSQEGDRLLKATRRVWDDHIGNMQKLGQVLRYMARGNNTSRFIDLRCAATDVSTRFF